MQSFSKTILASLIIIPFVAAAHQPRITESHLTSVPEPEISKAYYGTLTGEPDVYTIDAKADFELYVGVIVPDIPSQKKDISFAILKNGKEAAVFNGVTYSWQKFYEPFGADMYWRGPEYKAASTSGVYEIKVYSPSNEGKYSLAIGGKESFPASEVLNVLKTVPTLKKDFFEESPATFIKSPFGFGLILITYAAAFIFGFLCRTVLKKISKGTVRGLNYNIGSTDRVVRFLIAVALFAWAILTTWNPLLLFVSGFALFEAMFSWCGLYAALGRNTCPI
jgi:hypothetical protein